MINELDRFFDFVSKENFFSNRGNLGTPKKLQRYLGRLFAGIDVLGKRVLDIGAGTGVFSVYLSLLGAKSVHALEPEQAGSQNRMNMRFQKMTQSLGISNIVLENKTLQEVLPSLEPFDLVLLHNCINHFNEEACAQLHCLPKAHQTYSDIFGSLNRITRFGGRVLLADCSRHNVFDVLGFQSPFCPSIDWEIHQPPEVWLNLAMNQGFEIEYLRWTALGRFGDWSHWLLANRFAAYFLLGHFALTLRKVRSVDPKT